MSTSKPSRPAVPFWTSLVQYYRNCLSREQELGIQVPADPNARVILHRIEEHLITRKASTTIISNPAHTQPILAYLNRRGRGIGGTFIYGYPLVREGERLYPICYTEVTLEPGTAPQTVVLTRGMRELLFNRFYLRFAAGLTDAEIAELQRSWLSSRGPEPVELLNQFLAGVDLQYDAVLFGAEGFGQARGPARELQLMEQLRKDRLPDGIRIFSGEQGLPAARPNDDYLAIQPLDADQVQVVKRWRAPFLAVSGPAGSGKSRAAACLVASAAAAGQRVLWVSPDGQLPDELLAAFPGVLRIGSKEAWLASLQRALEVLEALRGPEEAVHPDGTTRPEEPASPDEALAAESRELARELDRLQAEERQASALADLGKAMAPVAGRVEADLARHPRRDWIAALAGRITEANADQFRPEQLAALRDLHVRALSWTEEGGSLGARLAQMRRAGQIKSALRQAGIPEFCHPEGDLPAQVEGLGLLLQAYPLLLTRARQIQAQAGTRRRSLAEAAAAVQDAARRKAEVDRRRLEAAWLQRVARFRPHLDQIIASVKAEIASLERGDDRRSILTRQRFSDLLAAFPVVVTPHLAVAGIVPNEPEMFDLLVVDDAHRLQIPAFLPVLYRAKHVALLGDESAPPPVTALGPDEDARLLNQVEGHNLAPFTYTEMTPLHRALAVAGPQTRRLSGRYQARLETQFTNVADGQTQFAAPAAISQARNPLEARAVLLQVAHLVEAGVDDVAIVSPFSGQVRLLRQLLERLAQAERDPVRTQALARVPVYPADGITRKHRAVVLSLVLAAGATPEGLAWLEERRGLVRRALDCATEQAVIVGHRATLEQAPGLAEILDGAAGAAEAPAGGLQPEAFGLLPTERETLVSALTATDAIPEGLTASERELLNRLSVRLRQRGVLLAPRLPLAWALGAERLAALPPTRQEAALTTYPLVTVIDGEQLMPLAVVELEQGEPGPAAVICAEAGLQYLAVPPGDWDRLREWQL